VRWPSARRVGAIVALLVVGGVLLRAAIWWHFAAQGLERNWFVEEIYYPTHARLDGLLAGVVLAVIATYRPKWWSRLTARPDRLAFGGLAGMALALWLFRERTGVVGNTIGWPVLSFALAALVASAASGRGVLGTLRLPGAAWIATISYSLYLSHKLVFQAVSAHFDAQLDGLGLLAFFAYAIATLAAGALLHYAVERPFLRLRDRRERGMRLPAPESVTSKKIAVAREPQPESEAATA
jgi:peptidoglycan/LPS O-acetylase OafA/YrhL